MSSSSSTISSTLGSINWFDAFKDNGGPVLYSSINRTAAIEDIRNILIYIKIDFNWFNLLLVILNGIYPTIFFLLLICYIIHNILLLINTFLKKIMVFFKYLIIK